MDKALKVTQDLHNGRYMRHQSAAKLKYTGEI